METASARPQPVKAPGRQQLRLGLGRAFWLAWVAQCRPLGADPAMALVSLWAVFWHRCWAQDELALGLLDERRFEHSAEACEPPASARVLALRSVLAGDSSWADQHAAWQKQAAAAQRAQRAQQAQQAERVQQAERAQQAYGAQAQQPLSPAPQTFQVAAHITEGPMQHNTAALQLQGGAGVDVVLLLLATNPGGISVALSCDAAVLDRAGLRRLRSNFMRLVHSALVQPTCAMGLLPLVSRAEQRLMAQWNRTAVAVAQASGGAGLHHLIEQQVRRTPDAVAVVVEGSTLSFAELDARANHWAQQLQQRGVRRGAMVGVLLERSFDMVVAMLAVWKAGGAYLPLEPDFPAQRLHDTLADSAAALVLTHETLQTRLPPVVTALCMDAAAAPAGTASSAVPARDDVAATASAAVRGDDPCYVIYTSGSTGKPKGAVLPHRAICNHMAWMVAHHRLGAGDHVLQKTPFSFDASVWEFLAPLLTGARLVLARPGGHRDMPYLARTIAQHRVTTLQLVPSVLQLLVDEPGFADCTSLKRVFCGGEALTTALVQRFDQRFVQRSEQPVASGQSQARTTPPRLELINLYGPTECCIDTTTFTCSAQLDAAVQPIGRPIWNTTHHVLDERLQPLPLGVPGELYIGGAGLALGYLHREQLTAEKFINNPFDADGSQPRLYRTGDRVRLLPDGNYEFLGRIDFQVKLNGFRIELGEIEAVLEAHPQVRQAVVLLREDRPGHKLLVAYVMSANASQPSTQDLRQHMTRQLPSHMLPGLCVVLPNLPLTANGKVDRRALPAPQQPASNSAAAAQQHTATEAQLLDIWAEVLATRHLGLDDDYFALGGDSLGLMHIGLAVRTQLGVEVDPEHLFEHTTLRAQAAWIAAVQRTHHELAEGAAAAARLPLPALPLVATAPPEGNTAPASVEQTVFWSGAQALRGWPLFNTSEVIGLPRPLQRPALQQAVNTVVARHENLRTLLQPRAGTLWQTVAPAGVVPIEHIQAGPGERELLPAVLATLVQQPLDLQRGPAVRWVLVALPNDEHALVLIVHHALTDGHSTQRVVHDLLVAYEAQISGSGRDASQPHLRYLDYAAWQHNRQAAGEFNTALAYWQQQLQHCPPPLRLPADLPRRAIPRWQGGRETCVVHAALRADLKRLAASHKASLYMVLLTAFAVLLWEQTAQDDLVIGTSVAGRSNTGLQELAGCTISSLPLRLRLAGSHNLRPVLPPMLRALLLQVRQTCLEAYAHQDLPLAQALEQALENGTGPALHGGKQLLPVWLELHDRQHGWEHRFAHLGARRHDLDRGISESELSLEIDDTGSSLVCHAQYKTGLFFAPRVQAWLARYQQLLQLLVAVPNGAAPAPATASSSLTP